MLFEPLRGFHYNNKIFYQGRSTTCNPSSPLFQNTALHLTVIHGHTDIVSCLLSHSEQQILMNKKNHNVLDSTIDAERKNVALAIASHNRSGRKEMFFPFLIMYLKAL